MAGHKQIKPDDFSTPDNVKKNEDKVVTTDKAAGTDNTSEDKEPSSLEDLVKSQARLIEKLENRLDSMDKKSGKTPALSPQEEMKRIELASKSQREALVEKLNAQPKFAMMIPLGINEKPGGTHEVGINGVVFVYPKGQMISVPQTVFELLSAHFNITSSAGKDMLVDRDEAVNQALS
jgi:hypothetical protein